MARVSRTMLAVIAAIQSGAHTRRKPKYIRRQALVSFLYDSEIEDSPIQSAVYFEGLSLKEVVVSAGIEEDQHIETGVTFEGLSLKSLIVNGPIQGDPSSLAEQSIEFTGLEMKTVVVDSVTQSENENPGVQVAFESLRLDTVVVESSIEEDQNIGVSVEFIGIILETE